MRISMLLVVLAVLCLPAHAQPPATPTMEIVGPSSFRAPVGHVLDAPLRVRVRDAQGRPWAGITVQFDVIIGGNYFGGMPPPFGKYGVFVTGNLPSSVEQHSAVTDADGVASSLPYRVSYDSEGAWAHAASGFPGNGALGTVLLRADFNVERGNGAGPVSLPVNFLPFLLVLVAGFLGLAWHRLAGLRKRVAAN